MIKRGINISTSFVIFKKVHLHSFYDVSYEYLNELSKYVPYLGPHENVHQGALQPTRQYYDHCKLPVAVPFQILFSLYPSNNHSPNLTVKGNCNLFKSKQTVFLSCGITKLES